MYMSLPYFLNYACSVFYSSQLKSETSLLHYGQFLPPYYSPPDDPSCRDPGMQKTPGGRAYQDAEHPDIGSIILASITQTRISLTPDTELITRVSRNIIAE